MKQTRELNNRELSSFCEQLGMLLSSGISALEGISILAENAPTAEGKKLLSELASRLEEEGSLTGALSSFDVFPPYMKEMIEIGEKSGCLDDVTLSLHEYYDRRERLSAEIRSAVAYPCLMIGIMAFVVVVLIVKVMPIFQQVFAQLGTEMSGFSLAVLNLGVLLGRYSIFFVALLVLILVCALYLAGTKKGRRQAAGMGRHIPPIRRVMRKIALSRFAAGLSLTLGSGLGTDESLEMLARLTEDPEVKAQAAACRTQVAEGAGLEESLEQNGLVTGVSAHMVRIGALTGALDETLRKIADRSDREVSDSLNRLVSLLEPTLVAILSILVGMILLSVMMPLMGVMSGIG